MSPDLYEQAWAHLEGGSFAEAQAAFLEMLAQHPEARREADARIGLAGALHAQGCSDPALLELHRALRLREGLGDDRGVASTHNNLGVLNLELGNIGLAAEHFEVSRRLLSTGRDDGLRVQVLANLSRAQGDYGDQPRAEALAREGLSLLSEQTSDRTRAALLLNLAESLRAQGQYRAATDHYGQALALATSQEALDQTCRAQHGLALLEAAHGRNEEALDLMRAALCAAEITQDASSQVLCLSGLARLERTCGRPDAALALARQALGRAQASARRLEELGVHDLMCDLLAGLGRPAEALEHAADARRLERDLKSRENAQRVMLLNTIHDVEQVRKEREAAQRAREVAEAKVREQVQELEQLALYDALTGLPNRTLFRDRLRQRLQRPDGGEGLLVGVLDLDRFKRVNDALGRPAGDALLQHTARRLQEALQGSQELARSGGNEFLLLLDGPAEEAATRLLTTLSAVPLIHGDQELVPRATLGLASFPQDGHDADTLLRHAERAMHHTKQTETGWGTFDRTVRAAPIAMDRDLQRALREQQFVLHHQPQVETRSGRVLGVETLLRWQHPERGLVPPGDFIPALEESNLILDVGAWVLREACRQIAPLGELRVSVNLSVRQFQLGDQLIEVVKEALQASGLAPQRLELELTESLVMRNAAYAGGILERLRDLGVRVSIDDFGTGHSSLAYLRHFALDALKIDRAFIRELEGDLRDRAIVETIVHLAHGLELEVVAEGIETASQAQVAAEIGVDLLQGWHYARALPLPELLAYLESAGRQPSALLSRGRS